MSTHILLVEDEPDVRTSMAKVLELRGHTVTAVACGEEALETMRTLARVDLILLDLMLPKVDGWQLREKQLEEGLFADVPVVIISGASHDLSEEMSVLKAVHALRKPIGPETLYRAVDTYGRAD